MLAYQRMRYNSHLGEQETDFQGPNDSLPKRPRNPPLRLITLLGNHLVLGYQVNNHRQESIAMRAGFGFDLAVDRLAPADWG